MRRKLSSCVVWPPTPVPMIVAVRSDRPFVEVDARLRDRLARRHHRELRHAVQRRDLALVEMLRAGRNP